MKKEITNRWLGTVAHTCYLQWRNQALLSIPGFLEWSICQVRLLKLLTLRDQSFHLHYFLGSLSYWIPNQSKGGMVNPRNRRISNCKTSKQMHSHSHTVSYYKYTYMWVPTGINLRGNMKRLLPPESLHNDDGIWNPYFCTWNLVKQQYKHCKTERTSNV